MIHQHPAHRERDSYGHFWGPYRSNQVGLVGTVSLFNVSVSLAPVWGVLTVPLEKRCQDGRLGRIGVLH